MTIEPLKKNLRVCENCHATYCVNGDPSGYWCQLSFEGVPQEGKCEFCRDTGTYSLNKKS